MNRQLAVVWEGRTILFPLAFPGLTGKFLDRSTGLYKTAAQLQPDRKLYATHVGAKCPADPLPSQPDGLPLSARE